jgi:hydroxyacylglutathione hydrolase
MNHIVFIKQFVLSLSFLMISFAIAGQASDTCYKATLVAEKTWAIVENKTVNIYLVEGNDSALIIDTGYGTGDLKSYIKTLTKLPVRVVNTHGHRDHSGNDHQFPCIYAHPADFGMIAMPPELIPVKEGFVFDLGDRRLEVIEVPGHTHGSICLLDLDNRILFAGDNTNSLVWLFLKDCYPLEVYLKSLQKVEKRMDEYDIILPGHNTPLDKTFVSEQIGCVKSILDGTCTPVPYNYSSFTAGAMLCKYKTAQVAYDPDNLFIKQQHE